MIVKEYFKWCKKIIKHCDDCDDQRAALRHLKKVSKLFSKLIQEKIITHEWQYDNGCHICIQADWEQHFLMYNDEVLLQSSNEQEVFNAYRGAIRLMNSIEGGGAQ